jgi:DNA-binding transcriptional ArsR family regulator
MSQIQKLERYFSDVLGLKVEPKPWQDADRLPFFLQDAYLFYEVSLLGVPSLIMESRDVVELSPAVVRDHIERIKEQSNKLCIYLRPAVSAYNRKRLIEQRVPFVVPGKQMYLPDLGIDLREHFRKLGGARKSLSPAAQTVVLYELVFGTTPEITPSELATKLGYTRMTMTRALDELATQELAEVNRKGRERWLRFPSDRRALWQKAEPFMRSPVKKRIWAKHDRRFERWIIAGLSALPHYSMLNPPQASVFALSRSTWRQPQQDSVAESPFLENGGSELELWSYEPERFAQNRLADPFSLYLSLRENRDERVQQALSSMIEQIQW